MQKSEDSEFEMVQSWRKINKNNEIAYASSLVPPKSRSTNRFEILNTGNLIEDDIYIAPKIEEEMIVDSKKTKAASAGVIELMNTLKPRKKGQGHRGKNKQPKVGGTILGGQSSS